MFKFLMEVGLTAIFAITLLTQIVVPAFIPSLNFFWFFRRKDVIISVIDNKSDDSTVEHLVDDLKTKKNAFKESDKNVDEAIDALSRAKKD